MFYFKKIDISAEDKQKLEMALRNVSSERLLRLDFEAAISEPGSTKLFLVYDGRKTVRFTRTREGLARLLPKMVVSIPRSADNNCFKIRYSIPSIIAFLAFFVFFALTLASAVWFKSGFAVAFVPLILLSIYLALTLLELKICGGADCDGG